MPPELQSSIEVEVVYALPDAQYVTALTVGAGTTVREAIESSGLMAKHPEIDAESATVGIYGHLVSRDTVLHDGDRIEIYRALLADPKQARRRRASRER